MCTRTWIMPRNMTHDMLNVMCRMRCDFYWFSRWAVCSHANNISVSICLWFVSFFFFAKPHLRRRELWMLLLYFFFFSPSLMLCVSILLVPVRLIEWLAIVCAFFMFLWLYVIQLLRLFLHKLNNLWKAAGRLKSGYVSYSSVNKSFWLEKLLLLNSI